MSDITVVIPAKNEAKNLATCIVAVTALGPIVVIDSGSIDDTKTIAESAGAEVLDFDWDGHFPKKRNWFLRTYEFKTDWVLFLDADEFVSTAFIDEVKRSISDT